MFPGAVYSIEHKIPVYGKKVFVIEIIEEKKVLHLEHCPMRRFQGTETHPKHLPVNLQYLPQDVHRDKNRGLKLKKQDVFK